MKDKKDKIEIVSDRKEALLYVGLGLYESELEEKLDAFKSVGKGTRNNWTTAELDTYLRKLTSTRIVNNEFRVAETVGGKQQKIKSDKDMIATLAQETNIAIMAIKYVYDDIKKQLHLDSSKKDAKDFITAQIYAQIDEIDLAIMEACNEKTKVEYHKIKMQLRDQLAKIENLAEKQQVNNLTVGGNLNQQTVNNVDKQLITSEKDTVANFIASLLPGNRPEGSK